MTDEDSTQEEVDGEPDAAPRVQRLVFVAGVLCLILLGFILLRAKVYW